MTNNKVLFTVLPNGFTKSGMQEQNVQGVYNNNNLVKYYLLWHGAEICIWKELM